MMLYRAANRNSMTPPICYYPVTKKTWPATESKLITCFINWLPYNHLMGLVFAVRESPLLTRTQREETTLFGHIADI